MKRYMLSTVSILIATTAITTVANAAEIDQPTIHQHYVENLDARNKSEKLEIPTSTTTFPENNVESLMDVS